MLDHFIDMHCHVLPGIDDGADDINISKAMLCRAYDDGIRQVIVTPHNKAHRHSAGKETIEGLTRELQNWLNQEGISITLYTGNEILYRHGIGDLLDRDEVCSLADSFYVLVEFNPGDAYAYIKNGIQEIVMEGKTPIIAHIERYDALAKHDDRIEELLDMGAYMQVNAKTVEGKAGFFAKQRVLGWIKKGFISFVASDGHNLDDRPQLLRNSASIVEKKFGPEVAERLYWANQICVIEGKRIPYV